MCTSIIVILPIIQQCTQLRFLNKGKIFKTVGKNLLVGLFNSASFSLHAK
jgi:hypothetical protein